MGCGVGECMGCGVGEYMGCGVGESIQRNRYVFSSIFVSSPQTLHPCIIRYIMTQRSRWKKYFHCSHLKKATNELQTSIFILLCTNQQFAVAFHLSYNIEAQLLLEYNKTSALPAGVIRAIPTLFNQSCLNIIYTFYAFLPVCLYSKSTHFCYHFIFAKFTKETNWLHFSCY